MSGKEYFQISFLVVVSFFLLFYKLGKLPLLDPDEARYAETAREMKETGNLLLPHFNYELRLNKPVLFYWLIYLSYFVYGVGEWAARFPSALAAFGAVLVTFLIGRELYERTTGLLAGLILATSWEFLIIARLAIIDMLLCFFIILTIFFFIKFLKSKAPLYPLEEQRETGRGRIYLYALWVSMACAFLSKGPVGLIPIVIFLIYAAMDKKMGLIRELFVSPAFLVFLLLGFYWYIALLLKIGFREGVVLFRQETIERFVSGYIHREKFFYYLPVILAGFLPWSLFLPWIKIRSKDKFVLAWVIGIIIFFSFSKSKVATYILSVFPALSLFIANFWQGAFKNKIGKMRPKMVFSVVLFFTIVILSFLWADKFVFSRYGIALSGRLSPVFVILVGVVTIGSIYYALIKRAKRVFLTIIFFSLLAVFSFYKWFAFDLANVRSSKKLIYPLRDIIKTEDELIAYNVKRPSLVFYAQHKINFIEKTAQLREYLEKTNNRLFLILNRDALSDINQRGDFSIENEHRGYLIVRREGSAARK